MHQYKENLELYVCVCVGGGGWGWCANTSKRLSQQSDARSQSENCQLNVWRCGVRRKSAFLIVVGQPIFRFGFSLLVKDQRHLMEGAKYSALDRKSVRNPARNSLEIRPNLMRFFNWRAGHANGYKINNGYPKYSYDNEASWKYAKLNRMTRMKSRKHG